MDTKLSGGESYWGPLIYAATVLGVVTGFPSVDVVPAALSYDYAYLPMLSQKALLDLFIYYRVICLCVVKI